MARDFSLLEPAQPSSIVPAGPVIAHVQLRDLLICPREQGVVNYVVQRGIVEQDLNAPGAPIRVLSNLSFTPNSLTSLQIGNDTLIAAGGQDTEIHLSLHVPSPVSSSSTARRRRIRMQWEMEDSLTGSINNSVLLTSLSLTRSNESSVDPRVGISNNDGSVRLYDVPLRVPSARRKLHEVGQVRIDVPVNHSSISPDGRTLLSVGDSNKIYFHHMTGGARITFQPITTLTIPPPDSSPFSYSSSSYPTYPSSSYTSLAAAFSTAFSGDGSKFAVASQEGVVAVWDVRSTKPMKVFHTNKTRGIESGVGPNSPLGNGSASGWLSDDPWEWTRGTKAPGWCVRSVKFNNGMGARIGKEVMAFTEHTSLVNLVDARTFETHDIIRVPALPREPESMRNSPRRMSSSSNTASTLAAAGAAARVRRARRAVGSTTVLGPDRTTTSLSGRPMSRAELFEAALAEQSSASSSTATSRNLIRRLLPVSNARRSGADAGRISPPPPESPRARLARRASIRSVPPPDGSSSTTPGRLTPTTAYRLPTVASARIIRPMERRRTASASEYSAESTSATSTSRTQSTAGGATPSIVQALGDAFRIPLPASVPSGAYSAPASIGDSTWRTLSGAGAVGAGSLSRVGSTDSGSSGTGSDAGGAQTDAQTENLARDLYAEMRAVRARYERSLDARTDAEENAGDFGGEGIVVVPDLGDRDVESEVHALLAVHGIESRLGSGSGQVARTQSTNTDATAHTNGSAGAQTAIEYEAYLRGIGAEDEEDEDDMDADDDGVAAQQAWFLRELASLGGAAREMANPLLEQDEDEESHFGYFMDDMIAGERREREEDEDDRMDVDEDGEDDLDFECASHGSTSRSGSPFSAPINTPAPAASMSSSPPSSSLRYGSYAGLPPAPWALPARKARRYAQPAPSEYRYFEDLDIAGLCFDPWGEKMYVAGVGVGPAFAGAGSGDGAGYLPVPSSGGCPDARSLGVGAIVEWSVRGADKRWWVDDDGWM